MKDAIIIRGARQHNLQDVDVEIPRDSFVVITGPSGSGKSSLAFDTIYAEGQRRYVSSLSAYARQFLDQMEKPDVDSIEGLSPAISIEQKTTSRNPRSTVGTITEIYDYLRLLYSTVGKARCWECGTEISSQSVQQIVDQLERLPAKTKLEVLAPVVRGRKGEYKRELADFRKQGFLRVRIDGVMYELDEDIVLARNARHDIDVVVDRLMIKPNVSSRLTKSVEVALRLAEDTVTVSWQRPSSGGFEEQTFSTRFACSRCGHSFSEISPRTFSFNSPHGACPDCNGLGRARTFDDAALVTDAARPAHDGALGPWGKRLADRYSSATREIAVFHDHDADTPWGELGDAARAEILHGTGERRVAPPVRGKRRPSGGRRPFAGVIPTLLKRYRESESDWVRGELEKYMTERQCTGCEGARLGVAGRNVLLGGHAIHQVAGMPLDEALATIECLPFTDREREVSKLVVREIVERLGFLLHVGVSYLTLDRPTGSLSGGESQRIRLATQIGAGLSGVLYVLDEPSIGLHQRDNARLLESLRELADRGNSVLVVEHDADTMLAADHILDMGPGAANQGGFVVAQGTPKQIQRSGKSMTGRYLAGHERIEIPGDRREGAGKSLKVVGARHNNLRDVTAEFPLGKITCVTGVSGSGKSSLVIDTLHAALARDLHRSEQPVGAHDRIEGMDAVDKVIEIDQTPIGRTPRSNPATYTGLFTEIRDIFAMLPESRMRGYAPGRFSFNVAGGRCEGCGGDGMKRVEMHFLPDIYVTCDVCNGRRYNRETLEVRYKDHTIADVLDLSVGQALELMNSVPTAKRKLETLASVGLDYIGLGQSATTLSGGEAQRMKLAKELSKRSTGRTVYILDEPTTGLHFADVRRLLEVLGRLADAGNTVIVIEHHLDVVKTADWVVDIGPEGGSGGGSLVVAGTPEEVAACKDSHTGRFLAPVLSPMAA